MQLNFHKGLYDQQMQTRLGGPPDVAIALNAGLGTPHYRWQRALRVLAKNSTPFLFTDYNEYSVQVGVNLVERLGMKVTIPTTLNPFRQPMRWPEASDKCWTIPWISNGFLCGANT